MPRPVVQSLWIGSRLSVMEQLTIRSFLRQGCEFHLYCYEPLEGAPPGTIVRDAREILPVEEIFVYRRGYGKGSPSAFSNYFRYKLMYEQGGWWADLDVVCVRPLDFDEVHVAGLERQPNGTTHVGSALIKAAAGSPLIEYCLRECEQVDRRRLRWGQIGPRLFARAIKAVDVPIQLVDPDVFYPIDFWQVKQFLSSATSIPADCRCVHLWHSAWKSQGLDPNARFSAGSLYEQFKTESGVETPQRSAHDSLRATGNWIKRLGRALRLADAA